MSEKVLGNCKTGLVFVVSAPAGTGKTTLVQMLVDEFSGLVEKSISYTTRPRRPGEIPGIDYHFVSKEEFQNKLANEEMLEYAELYGYYYGTASDSVRQQQKAGKHVILVIDTQGALKLKGNFPAVLIFLKPPSQEVLRQRLAGRRTECSAVIEQRLAWAERELEAIKEYDYCVVNDDLKTAYSVLRSILIAEEHRVVHSILQKE